MYGKIKTLFEKDAGTDRRKVAILYDEQEYAEAIVEHLVLRFDWDFVLCNEVNPLVEEATLILAEEGWFEQLRHRDDLWNKTVFFLEHPPQEEPLTRNEFPYLVWKYDGFSNLRHRIGEAMDELYGRTLPETQERPPVIIAGAWDYKDSDSWELACELAGRVRNYVLYVSLEKFPEMDRMDSLKRDNSLENLLYYVLDRMEMEGLDSIQSIRSHLDVRNKVCSLPGFNGYNPLLCLKAEQWDQLLPSLCQASEADVVFLWTGREEMDHCFLIGGKVLHCIYVMPDQLSEEEERRWKQMQRWMENEGTIKMQKKVHMAGSWTEAFETVVNYGYELV